MKPMIVLAGPTAVGKTKTSIALAKAVGGEIISADSMQVYRHMDIGSAKIRPEEMEGIPHHLIDVLDPSEEFNVVCFQQMAKQALGRIYENGHIPVLVGGTGFYIQALLYDIHFADHPQEDGPGSDYQKLAEEKGAEFLHDLLEKADPVSAAAIHPNNIKRTIRALEYFDRTGEPISRHNQQERQRKSPYRFAYFVLNDERGRLYERIDRRVDEMVGEGLFEEVRRLKEAGMTKDMVSMQGIGYKEILACLEGEYTPEEAVRILKRNTRHFAKRQLTWFRRERDVIWIDKQAFGYEEDRILNAILDACVRRGVLTGQNYTERM